ncbi:MAG: Hpt domain-containing protein [Pseudomonadota bacterium]
MDPFARQLRARYLRRRQDDLTMLAESLAKSDFTAIRDIGHKLYGSGVPYGLDEVSRLGGELEDAAKSQQAEQIAHIIEQIRTCLRDIGTR